MTDHHPRRVNAGAVHWRGEHCAGIIGLTLVLVTLADAVDTLVSTRIRAGRWWPTDIFYRTTWPLFRAVASRPRGLRRRETLLSLYGPLSLIALLGLWTFTQICGWALEMRPFDEALAIADGLRAQFHPQMEAFIDELIAPRGFWGVTSAETPTDVDQAT